jgi:maltooligosyltrehalose trehalohydrolase
MCVGARYSGKGQCEFIVWAPLAQAMAVRIVAPQGRTVPMERAKGGYWRAVITEVPPHSRYVFLINGELERPDPASHFQPEGVHGPSAVVDHAAFEWTDAAWQGTPLSEYVIYELHTGTFTEEGTFDAVIPRLSELKEIGINAVELMPVAQFPGARNWGYDGVYPSAVQNSYGGPEGLKRLADACHGAGMALILDVVYNHMGPEGNYLSDFGPYFTDKYKTPWGSALNFDDADCGGPRNFFIESALHWFRNYHVDALRLDAVHAIIDVGAQHFLEELAERTRVFSGESGRQRFLIAETNQNDARIIAPREKGGYGIDAQWSDDFHHVLHTLLTGEKDGYYMDFGELAQLTKVLREGYVHTGDYSPYRRRRHGSSPLERAPEQFVVFSQNHDQIGNRLDGARLSTLVSFEAQKLSAALVILSPYVPLFYMGEEYGETAPFLYFVHHSDPALIAAVRAGRKKEFEDFGWKEEPPDPQAIGTFLRSKIDWKKRNAGQHRVLLDFHGALLRMRKQNSCLARPERSRVEVTGLLSDRVVQMRRRSGNSEILCLFNVTGEDLLLPDPRPEKGWRKILDSSEPEWEGPGSALPTRIRGWSAAVYRRETS